MAWARPLGYALLFLVIVTGCSVPKAVLTPTPPAPPPSPSPVMKPPPPPALSPQVSQPEEARMKQEARARIEGTEQMVKQITQKKLAKDQEDTLSTIRSFIEKAKEALALQDLLRAFNLADKAQILANDLLRAIQ